MSNRILAAAVAALILTVIVAAYHVSGQVTGLSATVYSLNTTVSELSTTVSEVRQAVPGLAAKDDLGELDELLGAISETTQTLATAKDLDALREMTSILDATITRLDTKVEELVEAVPTLDAAAAEFLEIVTVLRLDVTLPALRSDVTHLQGDVKSLKSSVIGLREESEKQGEQFIYLGCSMAEFHDELVIPAVPDPETCRQDALDRLKR